MEQTGVVAGSGTLTDWISLGVLASSVPRDVVDEAIAETGKGARRAGGKLPPHVMVYFVMAVRHEVAHVRVSSQIGGPTWVESAA